jgi:hypothetical protein
LETDGIKDIAVAEIQIVIFVVVIGYNGIAEFHHKLVVVLKWHLCRR